MGGCPYFPIRSFRAGSINWPPVTRFNWRVDYGIGIRIIAGLINRWCSEISNLAYPSLTEDTGTVGHRLGRSDLLSPSARVDIISLVLQPLESSAVGGLKLVPSLLRSDGPCTPATPRPDWPEG